MNKLILLPAATDTKAKVIPTNWLRLYSLNNTTDAGIIIINAKSEENPITIHNNENTKKATFLGNTLFIFSIIAFKNPDLIANPIPIKPIIVVPKGK